ncbi:MAG: hypothetical protein J6W26_02055, partial [Bacteroidales bacterium]|nr:hypothetical protein [Bacteroidales bacterium]
LQTVTATVLYGGEEAEYPGGVYTVLDMVIRGQAYYDRLHFTGDATIILPDWCSFGVAATKEDNEYWLHVDGDLTIYGQEYGNGQCLFSNVTVNGHVNVYGGWVVLYNISANEINLSWTSIQNEHMVNPTQGTTVNLLKDFMYYDDDNNRHVINAQQNVDITTIAERYLKPYAETIDVSYIDENGDTHTENATVLFGDETSLSGGTYTIINYTSFSQAVSFSGNTKLIIPDGIEVYGYYQGGGINLNVTGDLAIYGQENRSGTVLYINASVSGAVTVSNVRVIYSFINSESDILIAGGEHEYGQLSANGTITLGHLTFNDEIYCEDYEGTVAIRAGQKFAHQNGPFGDVILTGTLTDEEVAAIAGTRIYPYIEPTVTQTIALTAGWNWVSINVEVTLNELKAALVAAEPGASPTIKSKGKGQTAYNGTIWTGALKSIDLSQMYEIKVANDCEVMLEGVPVNPADHPVTIKSGANWIAYPLSTDMSVANAFADFGVKGDYVKSKTGGQAAWNGMIWTGALKRLVPGQGYIYNSTVSGDRTFTFPSEDQ